MTWFEEVTRTIAKPSIGLPLVALFLACYWDWPGSRHSKLPPGPRSWPVVGNIPDIKPKHVFEQLRQLHLQYGPIVSLKIGPSTLISIAGDGTHAHALFDKRGAIYSGRPYQAASEIAGKGDYLLFQQNSDKWRAARKPIVQHFAPSVMKTVHFSLQEAESVQLLFEFLRQPEDFMHHPMRFATSVLTCLAYGVRCESYRDPAVYQVEDIMRSSTDLNVPGAKPPVEVFPWLDYLLEAAHLGATDLASEAVRA